MKDSDRLNKTIFVAFLSALNVEAGLNNVLLLLQAPKFVELLRICGLIELHTAVPPYVQRQTVRFAWTLLAFQAVVIVLNVGLNVYSAFGTALLLEEGHEMEPPLMKLAISNGVLGVAYLSFMCLSTRLLLMYVARAIVLYLGCIYRNLDQCLRSRSTPESRCILTPQLAKRLPHLGALSGD
ncbi:hypothetical protein V5799_021304 [Amblyomma americanum]|uniref:Uncharacterized protein n=1 Tax=Amblyomma americanum TaxID=6943 RepID=A0AAQ4FNP5_AMBAM